MNRYIKLGYEGIELELPVHALYLYREPDQLIENIIPLITEGIERKEKVIYIGREQECKILKQKFKNKIELVGKGLQAADFVTWLKRAYDKSTQNYQCLRVFLESGKEFVGFETIIDDFGTQPELRIFLLCQYKINNIDSFELLDTLKTHPYVFVEHLLKPNCFYSRLKHRVWLDPLTGIFNRRYFENQLSKELQRASRYEHSLSLIFLDIDQFKKVNDEFGHQVGDAVLQDLSQILERSLRGVDVLARYGGDEFIILLPETKKIHAQKTAERILRNIENHDFFKDNLKVKEINVSLGISGFPEDAGGTYELIKKADMALYEAKRKGGGRIFLFE